MPQTDWLHSSIWTPSEASRHMDRVDEPVNDVLDEAATRREAAAAATPGPERVYPTNWYSRALLM